MRYQVLASDYDGTLATHGQVDEPTIAALERLLATGRRLVMVTGRELPELLGIFPRIELFEWVVAENGALLYNPATKTEKPIAEPPPPTFVEALRAKGVGPISIGRVIVATWEPHQTAVLETIREMGLDLQVIFNKGAVMILPAGVNKATGLQAALKEMGISPHNCVGVGDAENDHAMLRFCEFSAAVENALPAVKETADFVAKRDHGAGVTDLIDAMVENNLAAFHGKLERHFLPIGTRENGAEVTLPAYGPAVLIVGPSASGKSTVATSLLEAVATRKYQYCIVDPEGDYETLEGPVVFGGPQGPPVAEEVVKLLQQNPDANAVVSLTGMPIPDRPPFFLQLLPQLLQLRALTGRPHWLFLDEAHHIMPAEWQPPAGLVPESWRNVVLITVHPELLAPWLLSRVNVLMAVGEDAGESVANFASAIEMKAPKFDAPALEKGQVLIWQTQQKAPPQVVTAYPTKTERRRHRRKYAEGTLPPDRSFYFRGPEDKLNIRAQNLMLFLQIADGLDDETWDFHLRNGDFAKWFRDGIKDEQLAAEAEQIGRQQIEPKQTRQLIRQAIERDYTLPASPLPVPGAS